MSTTALVRAAVLLLALSSSACLTPPVVLAGDSLPLDQALERYPEPREALELAAVDGATLRGVFVPAEEGAAVVLHLLGATDSFGAPKFSHRSHVAQLRDLGLASLLVDYRGVGLSGGERSAKHLCDDAWVMWQEALLRAGGDPSRVGIRATSLGTIATALLLERGATPGAITLIAPVMPETVVRRYARVEHGAMTSRLAALLFSPVAEVEALQEFTRYAGGLLVCASPDDQFLSSGERQALKWAVSEQGGSWCDLEGGHYRSSISARALFARERTFWGGALPPRMAAPTPDELLRARPELAGELDAAPGARARLAELSSLKRHGDVFSMTAAAIALPDPIQARDLLWSLELRPYPELPFEELCEVLDLADAAGELPQDLLMKCVRVLDTVERLGLMRITYDAESLARLVMGVDQGASGITTTYSFGAESATVSLSPSALWRELLERGFSLENARRILLRILLRSERIPERLRPASGGCSGLEVFEEGAWKPLLAEGGASSGSFVIRRGQRR